MFPPKKYITHVCPVRFQNTSLFSGLRIILSFRHWLCNAHSQHSIVSSSSGHAHSTITTSPSNGTPPGSTASGRSALRKSPSDREKFFEGPALSPAPPDGLLFAHGSFQHQRASTARGTSLTAQAPARVNGRKSAP